jgi:hypothetical protein
MELSNLEICKNLAIVEGKTIAETITRMRGVCEVMEGKEFHDTSVDFNPVENSGLCHDLMIKHEVTLSRKDLYGYHYATHHTLKHTEGVFDKVPNRAICLAILKVKQRQLGLELPAVCVDTTKQRIKETNTGIENLRILAETTVDDFTEASLQRFIEDAVKDFDNTSHKLKLAESVIEKVIPSDANQRQLLASYKQFSTDKT